MSAASGRQPVAVTGLSLMTGLGLDLESSWDGLCAGRSPIRRFTLFDPQDLPSPFGVQLPDGAEALFEETIAKRSRSQMTRGTMMAVISALTAAQDANLEKSGVDPRRIGVVAGATGTGYAPRDAGIDPHRILRNMASAPAAWISIKGGWTGPSLVVSTACSSGIYALDVAYGLLESNRCDAVICGAADSALSWLDVQGFCSLMALSVSEDTGDISRASRPFDARRNGFVIGEGAGMLALERLPDARARSARIYALMHPPGLSSEAYNILTPRPDGAGMAHTMRIALAQAGLAPQAIDYINAHGTSTPHNDVCEVRAIRDVFGDDAPTIPISSTKSMTGHCLSAAAGVEAVICCLALDRQTIPPTANLTVVDPACEGLDFVPGVARKASLRHVMCNSFAFGGQNGVAVFSKP